MDQALISYHFTMKQEPSNGVKLSIRLAKQSTKFSSLFLEIILESSPRICLLMSRQYQSLMLVCYNWLKSIKPLS